MLKRLSKNAELGPLSFGSVPSEAAFPQTDKIRYIVPRFEDFQHIVFTSFYYKYQNGLTKKLQGVLKISN
jgi:hypothetical protein